MDKFSSLSIRQLKYIFKKVRNNFHLTIYPFVNRDKDLGIWSSLHVGLRKLLG